VARKSGDGSPPRTASGTALTATHSLRPDPPFDVDQRVTVRPVAKQRKPSGGRAVSKRVPAKRLGLDVQIADLSGRVFRRLESWAKMALIATLGLGLLAWVLGMVAVDGLRKFPMVAIFLLITLIPAIAAWIIGRRAKAIHQSVDGIQSDVKAAINDPEIRHLFDGFLGDGDDRDDGRAGLARLAKGALGVRKVVKERKDTLTHLWGAIRAMVTAPGILVVITAGLALLSIACVIFALVAIV
jgi:hypothetical protein